MTASNFSAADTHFMARALALAAIAEGQTSPNPPVGCVIVKEGRIIGEGFHHGAGLHHAEVEAVRACANPSDIEGATVYVTLEPCTVHGRTPPCAPMLAALRPARVVVGCVDPNPAVLGRGIALLHAEGITVEVGCMQKEAERLIRPFAVNQTKRRPYVYLKWAQTADGYMARPDYSSKWITGLPARALGHKLRSLADGVLVGYRTALHDDPILDTRLWPAARVLETAIPDVDLISPFSLTDFRNLPEAPPYPTLPINRPARIVVDERLALPPTLRIFTDEATPTIVLHSLGYQADFLQPHVQTIALDSTPTTAHDILTALWGAGLRSILVEGGAATLHRFIQEGLWDEAHVFAAQIAFGQGIAAPRITGLPDAVEQVGVDTHYTYLNR